MCCNLYGPTSAHGVDAPAGRPGGAGAANPRGASTHHRPEWRHYNHYNVTPAADPSGPSAADKCRLEPRQSGRS